MFLTILSFDESIISQSMLSVFSLVKFPVVLCASLRCFYFLLQPTVGRLPGKR